MKVLSDYDLPCGCHRITERNDKGEITSIDDGICRTHFRIIWEKMNDPEMVERLNRRFGKVATPHEKTT